jgi:hypothetical protein
LEPTLIEHQIVEAEAELFISGVFDRRPTGTPSFFSKLFNCNRLQRFRHGSIGRRFTINLGVAGKDVHQDRENCNSRGSLVSGHSWQVDKFTPAGSRHQSEKAIFLPAVRRGGGENGLSHGVRHGIPRALRSKNGGKYIDACRAQ